MDGSDVLGDKTVGWIEDFKKALFGERGFLDGEVVIDLPEYYFMRELAVHACVSLIANAISQCEIIVYKNGKQVKEEDWYTLNIRANVNESASRFWHKVTEKMLTAPEGKGAFVFTKNGNIYCADSYDIQEKRPFRSAGHIYSDVVVDDFQMNQIFTANNSMVFKLENEQANIVIQGMYTELDDLIAAAFKHYQDANIQRWKFKVNSREAGSQEFQKKWQEKLQKAVKKYVNGETNVYVEYDDRELIPINLASSASANAASTSDSISLIDKTMELVAKAYHIPPGIVTVGNYNINDLITQFLTFTVDPIADMIGKTLTASYYGPEEFAQANYYKVDTSKIKHFDIFGMASDVDKLISSGFATVNEVRHAADWDYAGDPNDSSSWLNQHILTKNYEKGGSPEDEKKKGV